jgi:hypothetical protein
MTSGDLFPSAGDGSEGSDEPQRLATPDLEDAGEILQRRGWGKGSSTIQICIYIYCIYIMGFKDPTIWV